LGFEKLLFLVRLFWVAWRFRAFLIAISAGFSYCCSHHIGFFLATPRKVIFRPQIKTVKLNVLLAYLI
jgi:hypothetical protein